MRDIKILIKTNLYARNATFFVQEIAELNGEIYLEKNNRIINAKSLLGILSLRILENDIINLYIKEEQSKENLEKIINLLGDEFI